MKREIKPQTAVKLREGKELLESWRNFSQII